VRMIDVISLKKINVIPSVWFAPHPIRTCRMSGGHSPYLF
jgi:hypothetical protein